MKNNKFGLTDLVFTILFPEISILQLTISELGTTRLAKRQMQKSARAATSQLPKFDFSKPDLEMLQNKIKELIDPGGTLRSARQKLLSDPGKLGQRLGTLTKEEKIELSEDFGDLFGIGEPDASKLTSSAVSFGIYTPTSANNGNLELTFINGGTYTYPGLPLSIWLEMKAATGKNGSGAYTIFYYGFWRAASSTKGARQISTAFKLAGLARR